MKLTFRKHEVKDLSQLQALVAENAEAVEPGFRVIATGVNFGRSTVEAVGLDRRGAPALMALGFVGDDAMLFRMVEAYGWSLEYPESVRRLLPDGGGAGGWPPRVVFVAERLPESFLRKIRVLAFPAVKCFEYRCVEVNDATGFYLDPVDWTRSAPSPAAPPAIAAAEPGRADGVGRQAPPAATRDAGESTKPPAAEPVQPSRWFGLLTPSSDTPSLERSPGRPQSPASAAASSAPIGEVSTVAEPPKAVAHPPAALTDAVEIADDRELAPAWRKFLEKLAGTLDLRPADDGPTAAPAEKTARTSDPENEPAHAGPARNGWANRHEDPRQRALLDVVTLPANGELVPQWRKFLEKVPLDDAKVEKFHEKPPLDHAKIEKLPEKAPLDDAKIGEFHEKLPLDDAKVAAVREYLHREFPMCTIYDFHEHQRNAQVLQLQDSQGKVSHLAAISFEFLETHGESELRTVLEKMRLSQAMRQAGQAGVLVTPSGPEIQKR